ncbi:MAG: endonuclease/exonuclease/phosphatase family protein [Actinomycetota bacterium]
MRVATWNLWWRYGDWEARLEAITRTLVGLDADVIGLQEVWHTEDNSAAERLAAALGLHLAFAASPRPEKWQQKIGDPSVGIGNAVLSRWPITATAEARLPAGDARDEGRMALGTTIATPWGLLPFTTTHVNSAWGQSAIREAQLRGALDLVATHDPAPFPPILCGDFNAAPDFDEIRALSGRRVPLVDELVLLDAWEFLRPLEPGWTWDRRNPHVDATNEPNARIDYLFLGIAGPDRLGRPREIGLFGDEPVNGIWPSDHFGVYADLDVTKPTGDVR